MPDATKDRPGDMAPSLTNGYIPPAIPSAGGENGTAHSTISVPAAALHASLKSLSHSHHQHTRSDSSPLSIAFPLSIRSNGHGAGAPTTVAPVPLPIGYLEQRRDTFHSLTHLPSSSLSAIQYVNNNNNSNNNISWSNHPVINRLDDHPHPPPLLHHRPQSLSYANQNHTHQQQQHAPSTFLDQDRVMRRRRLSTASSSSKQRLGSSASLRSKAHNTPHHTRRFTTLISDQEPDTTYLWGYLLFFATMVGFTVSMYALVASKYMPMTGNKTLDWIMQDSHYCMLVPVTIPVTVLAVLFNWLGMKLFRHN